MRVEPSTKKIALNVDAMALSPVLRSIIQPNYQAARATRLSLAVNDHGVGVRRLARAIAPPNMGPRGLTHPL